MKAKTLVKVSANKEKMTVKPLRALPYPVRSYTDEEIQEWLELDKAEGEELRRKGIMKTS